MEDQEDQKEDQNPKSPTALSIIRIAVRQGSSEDVL
jgi:hypothetical protein